MPYRALLWTIFTVALALVAVALWMRSVEPLVVGADSAAATQPANKIAATKPATIPARSATVPPEKGLRRLVQGTLILSFVLICMLLVIGLLGAFREWARFRAGAEIRRKAPQKTPYVDAWKIAGERLKAQDPKADDDDEPSV